MSDTLTGILTSFVSLGFGFQIIAVFLANKRPVKRWVTLLHCLNQLAFALIYFIPLAPISHEMKNFLFVAFLLIGYILTNVVNSPKINWFMSLVDERTCPICKQAHATVANDINLERRNIKITLGILSFSHVNIIVKKKYKISELSS